MVLLVSLQLVFQTFLCVYFFFFQAWQLRSKVCCGQKWLLLLYPVFLLFLTICVMTMTLPLPLPPADIDRRPSRALNSASRFRFRPRIVEPPPNAAFQQPLTHIHHRASSSWKETAPKPFRDAAGSDINSFKESHHTDSYRNKHNRKGITSKRKETNGANQHLTRHQHSSLPEFTVNNKGAKPRITPSNHSVVVKHMYPSRSKSTAVHGDALAHTTRANRHASQWEDGHANRNAGTQIHDNHMSAKLAEHHKALKKHSQHPRKSDKVSREEQAVKKPFRDPQKHHNLSEDPSEVRKMTGSLDHRKALSKLNAALKKDDSSWCVSFTERDFPDSDHRQIRFSPDLQPLPWLSKDDIQKMVRLAGGEVVSKVKVPAHGQVLQVALDPLAEKQVSVFILQ